MVQLNEAVVVDAFRSAIGKSGRKGMEKGGQLCYDLRPERKRSRCIFPRGCVPK